MLFEFVRLREYFISTGWGGAFRHTKLAGVALYHIVGTCIRTD